MDKIEYCVHVNSSLIRCNNTYTRPLAIEYNNAFYWLFLCDEHFDLTKHNQISNVSMVMTDIENEPNSDFSEAMMDRFLKIKASNVSTVRTSDFIDVVIDLDCSRSMIYMWLNNVACKQGLVQQTATGDYAIC